MIACHDVLYPAGGATAQPSKTDSCRKIQCILRSYFSGSYHVRVGELIKWSPCWCLWCSFGARTASWEAAKVRLKLLGHAYRLSRRTFIYKGRKSSSSRLHSVLCRSVEDLLIYLFHMKSGTDVRVNWMFFAAPFVIVLQLDHMHTSLFRSLEFMFYICNHQCRLGGAVHL